MLEEIRIRDLGVIAEAALPLGSGLTVVTGETGAGKTMVVTALGLLLGARADAGTVRTGAKAAFAEAVVRVAPGSPAAVRAADAGAEIDEFDGGAELLLARTVNAEGRSRAHIGGRSAPVGLLGEIGVDLVVVHGQSDQLRLRSQAAQRHALDKFAGADLASLLAEYQAGHRRWKRAAAEAETLRTQGRERLREAESLQAALQEIDDVDPQPGEDEALRVEADRLGNIEELRAAAQVAHQVLTADDYTDVPDAVSLIAAARQSLEHVGGHDPQLAAAAERLAEAGYLLADVGADLAGYTAALDAEGPERLAQVEARRAELARLVRKYAPSIDGVLAWAGQARTRLEELSTDSSRVEELEAEVRQLEAVLIGQAAAMTELRRRAAETLGARVSAELAALAMPDAVLEVDLHVSAELAFHGVDEVSFLLKPHPGAPARPLGKGASGGELSRVMLAIEVVLAAVDPVPTFVFDEVDAGVGGKAAVEIGRRLAMLARHVQVIVVTHLPQVAAFADRHILVTKAPPGGSAPQDVTASDVTLLDDSGRVRELARMLAGQEDSRTAQAHARELLADARPPR